MDTKNKIIAYLDANGTTVLVGSIIAFIAAVFGALAFKYVSFGYNAIDLGIYGQVFYNTSMGRLFEFSIHPHLYLGDHFELFILFLTPIYALIKSPLTLIFLQTVFVAVAAWPIYAIARQKLSSSWSLLIAVGYLLNPFTINLLFFEFHILPFAIPLIAAAFYFYYKKSYWPFVIFLLLSLTVREDVSLVVIMFGILALLEKRSIRWIILPIALGGGWLLSSMQLTEYFSGYASYKFLALYSWLGSTQTEIIINFFTKPLRVLQQLFSLNNIFLTIGLLVPLAALPLLKIRYLVPALLVLLQLYFTSVSSTIMLQSHYVALLIPFLYIAAAFSLSKILSLQKTKSKTTTFLQNYRFITITIIVAAILYSFATFSPLLGVVKNIANYSDKKEFISVQKQLADQITNNDQVVSSFSFLPNVSEREKLYSLHYAYIGKKQFSQESFLVPEGTDAMLIDFNDFLIYNIQSHNISMYRDASQTGADRINDIISNDNLSINTIVDTLALYTKNSGETISLLEKNSTIPVSAATLSNNTDEEIRIVALEEGKQPPGNNMPTTMPRTIYWTAQTDPTDDYELELTIRDQKKEIMYQKMYPLAYGLYPTSQWKKGEIVKVNYWFLIPSEYNDKEYQIELLPISIRGYMGLDGMRTASIIVTEKNSLGEPVTVNY